MEEILVDENGYKQFFEELKRLEDLSRSNSALGSEVYKDAVGDGWHDNFAFEESMRESRAIAEVITLTGNYIPNTTNEINEISLNSPLGKALFKAKIGTSTSYFVGNSEIFITILEKLNN